MKNGQRKAFPDISESISWYFLVFPEAFARHSLQQPQKHSPKHSPRHTKGFPKSRKIVQIIPRGFSHTPFLPFFVFKENV